MKYLFIILCTLSSFSLFGQLSSNYPQDGLIYNEFIGENIKGAYLANDWRKDTINGGYNKGFGNPYLNYDNSTWPKSGHGNGNYSFFRYSSGKLYTGEIIDTLVGGIIFKAKCINGLVQGQGVFYYDDGSKLSEGTIHNGEMVGDWVYYYPEKYLCHRVLYLRNNGLPLIWIEYNSNGEVSGIHKLQ